MSQNTKYQYTNTHTHTSSSKTSGFVLVTVSFHFELPCASWASKLSFGQHRWDCCDTTITTITTNVTNSILIRGMSVCHPYSIPMSAGGHAIAHSSAVPHVMYVISVGCRGTISERCRIILRGNFICGAASGGASLVVAAVIGAAAAEMVRGRRRGNARRWRIVTRTKIAEQTKR